MKIDWTLFDGSTHCEDGLGEFAMGEIKTFTEFEHHFLPYMKAQAKEVRRMKNSKMGIKKARTRAARAFKRITGLSVTEAYN